MRLLKYELIDRYRRLDFIDNTLSMKIEYHYSKIFFIS